MGVGAGQGKEKASTAAKLAISSPLLETSISGAAGILINITASPDIALEEMDIASHLIADEAAPDAVIIWGANIDSSLEDEMRITVIATSFDATKKKAAPAPTTIRTATPSVIRPSADSRIKVEPAGTRPAGTGTVPAVAAAAPTQESGLSDDAFNELLDILGGGTK
jgi:cell division protein FtsZ